jgi:hypothetical protein
MHLLVYDEKSSHGEVCTFLLNYFDFNVASCKIVLFKNFNPLHYDNYVIYFMVSLDNINDMFKLLQDCDTVFNAYILVLHKSNELLLNSLVTVDTKILIKKANFYGITLSCLELHEDNLLNFEDFFVIYNEVYNFENNFIYKLGKKELHNEIYFKNLKEKWNKINKFIRMSARDIQYSSKNIEFKKISSINNIKVSSLHCENKCEFYLPTLVYEILQKNSVKLYSNETILNHYFDKIYVLYLPRRENKTLIELKKLGIWNYSLYEGFDGSNSVCCQEEYKKYMQFKPSYEEQKVVGQNRRGIGSIGSWAILKSMHNMLVDAKMKGYSRILVLQDDTLFHKDFIKEFKQKISDIDDEQWKLLYLGASQHGWKNVDTVHSYYHPNGTTDGAFAVGINNSVFDDLLSEILKFNMPFDSGPLWKVQKKYHEHCYVMYKNIVIADLRSSDLRDSRDMKGFSQLFRWELHNYELTNQ